MEKFIVTFENLVRRGIAPSVAFFVIFGGIDLAHSHLCEGVNWNERLEVWQVVATKQLASIPEAMLTVFALLFILGLSYVLTTINQLLFDEFLRGNFGGPIFNQQFKVLRSRVQDRFGNQLLPRLAPELGHEGRKSRLKLTDFLLYEILGGIDPTNTRPFVDTAKALGVVFVSLIVSLGVQVLFSSSWACKIVLLTMAILVFWIGRQAIKAQYRSRSIRHYVNFLMMPDNTLTTLLERHEIELKAKKGGS